MTSVLVDTVHLTLEGHLIVTDGVGSTLSGKNSTMNELLTMGNSVKSDGRVVLGIGTKLRAAIGETKI